MLKFIVMGLYVTLTFMYSSGSNSIFCWVIIVSVWKNTWISFYFMQLMIGSIYCWFLLKMWQENILTFS